MESTNSSASLALSRDSFVAPSTFSLLLNLATLVLVASLLQTSTSSAKCKIILNTLLLLLLALICFSLLVVSFLLDSNNVRASVRAQRRLKVTVGVS